MNKKIRRYLEEIEKTEKKIADLQQYLKGIKSALKEEENNEMIRAIRGMKLEGEELLQFTLYLLGTSSNKVEGSATRRACVRKRFRIAAIVAHQPMIC